MQAHTDTKEITSSSCGGNYHPGKIPPNYAKVGNTGKYEILIAVLV